MGKGVFVMADGLDGSGKGTIVHALQGWAQDSGLRVFDLRTYCDEHLHLPEIEDLDDYDVILSAEPTYSSVGRAIRYEIIKNSDKRTYSGVIAAHAFSLDREILYRRIIIPALAAGKHVFQERGVITSLVYQPMQDDEISVGDILALPGNVLAMEHAPDLLVIPLVEAEEALTRLKGRVKNDDAIFETLEFQKKIKDRYTSDWLREHFEKRQTQIAYLQTGAPRTPEDTQKEVVKVFEQFLSSKQ